MPKKKREETKTNWITLPHFFQILQEEESTVCKFQQPIQGASNTVVA